MYLPVHKSPVMVFYLLVIMCSLSAYNPVSSSPVDPDDSVYDDDTMQNATNRIHGGYSTSASSYPFIAGLYRNNGRSYFCAGSLLQNGYVLTAAHCITDLTASLITVHLGSTRRVALDSGERRIGVSSIMVYSNKRKSRESPLHDIALLKLRYTPTTSSRIQPIAIRRTTPSGRVRALGWGRVSDTAFADRLQTLLLDVKTSSKNCGCHNTLHELCAKISSGRPCSGDSGGPLVKTISGKKYLVGVLARGWSGCPGRHNEVIYTKTSFYRSWILSPRDATDSSAIQSLTCSRYGLSSGGGGGGGCFPGTSLVQIQHKRDPVPISSLQPGDQVLTFSSSGQVIYSPFISYLHKHASMQVQYLVIHTQHNHTLHVSHNHLVCKANPQIQLTNTDMSCSYVFTGDLVVGDDLISLADGVGISKVMAIEYSQMNGFYAPLTDEGTIIVDGLFASCYASSPYHYVNHLATSPYRMWVKAVSAWYGNEVMADDNDVMPAYISMLEKYALPIMLSV